MSETNLLTTKEVAQRLRVTPAALRRFRLENRGPAFVKVGRLVRYVNQDLDEYLQANRLSPEATGH